MTDERDADAAHAALLDAARVLPSLPRTRAGVGEGRARIAALAARHPSVRIDLAVDLRPGSPDAEYDLLLEHPSGTFALTFRPERGHPWLVDYAEHWAANFVVSVGDVNVRNHQALVALQIAGDESPRVLDRLVDDLLIQQAMGVDEPDVSAAEVQAAVDALRAARGLHSAADTHAWLARNGWTVETLREMAANHVRAEKVGERLVAADVEPWFAAHAADFARVRWVRAETRDESVATRLANDARGAGVAAAAARIMADRDAPRLRTVVDESRAHELPGALAAAAPRAVVGPLAEGPLWWVGEVLSREDATLDARTRAAVRAVLLRRWLDSRREGLPVRWHWL